jgi:hypothetical protein
MRRTLVAPLLVAAACSSGPSTSGTPAPPSSTPDYGVQTWSGKPDGSNNCGDFAVGWQSPDLDGKGSRATLHAINGADMVLDLKGNDEREQLTAIWCGNIAGDERLELATQRFTGGAHCCFSVRVDTLDGPTLLEADLGNYGEGRPEPKQLDDDWESELVGTSDALAYFVVSFAGSPGFPLVFVFLFDRYVVATKSFPDYIRKQLTGAEKQLKDAIADGSEEAIKGMAIGVYAHHVLLGDADDSLDALTRQVPDAVASWLRKHADEAAKLVDAEATPAPK